jgi:hypothetical protein
MVGYFPDVPARTDSGLFDSLAAGPRHAVRITTLPDTGASEFRHKERFELLQDVRVQVTWRLKEQH